jgi:hypothetical protein
MKKKSTKIPKVTEEETEEFSGDFDFTEGADGFE